MNGQGSWRLTDLKRPISAKFQDTRGAMQGLVIMEMASQWPAIQVRSSPIWFWIGSARAPTPRRFNTFLRNFRWGGFAGICSHQSMRWPKAWIYDRRAR